MKKKYIKKNGDTSREESFNSRIIYFRILNNIKNEVYCNSDYYVNDTIIFKKNKKYNLTKTYKSICTNNKNEIVYETVYVGLITDVKTEFFIPESAIITLDNKVTFGKHLILEKIREFNS